MHILSTGLAQFFLDHLYTGAFKIFFFLARVFVFHNKYNQKAQKSDSDKGIQI